MNKAEVLKALQEEYARIKEQSMTEFSAYCDLPSDERDEERHRLNRHAFDHQMLGIEKAIEIVNSLPE